MSRACWCSVSHADAISPITTIQSGRDAMWWAKNWNYPAIISVLKQVVGEGVVVVMVCVCVCVCACVCDCVRVRVRVVIRYVCVNVCVYVYVYVPKCMYVCQSAVNHSLISPPQSSAHTLSLAASLTQSLTHSLSQSLTHSPTHSLTHSVSPSLTHSLTHLITHTCLLYTSPSPRDS